MTKHSTPREPAGAVEAAPKKFSKARPLAARIGIHSKTLFRWADAGLIHRYKINDRIVLFDEFEVETFIQKARIA